MIQTREGAGLSHFYASILSGFARATKPAGWRRACPAPAIRSIIFWIA